MSLGVPATVRWRCKGGSGAFFSGLTCTWDSLGDVPDHSKSRPPPPPAPPHVMLLSPLASCCLQTHFQHCRGHSAPSCWRVRVGKYTRSHTSPIQGQQGGVDRGPAAAPLPAGHFPEAPPSPSGSFLSILCLTRTLGTF